MRYLSSIVLVATVLATGCSHTLRFKTVDAKTDKPLAGVTLTWEDHKNDIIFGPSHFGPTNPPPSGDNGLIVVAGVHKGRVTNFDFTKRGYLAVSCIYCGGTLGQVDGTNSLVTDSGFVYRLPKMVPVSPTNRLMVIRMLSEQ